MFWSMMSSSSSSIEAILDEADVTLEKILDQDEVIQECRSTNKRLLEYLQRPNVMMEMLDLITKEPSSEDDLTTQYKYSSIACEVLTSDISFAEKMCAEKSFLDKLFHFFRDRSSPLNPVLASYVSRTIGEIVTRNLDQNWYSYQLNIIQIMGYLTTEPDVLQWIMAHIGTNAVCDLLYKVIMNVEGQDMRNNLFEWMEREQFVIRLMEKMAGIESSETHISVNKLVGDLLYAFRDDMSSGQERSTDADPFLVALRSPRTLEVLLEVIFRDFPSVNGSSISNGLDLTLALLGITKKPTKQRNRRNSLIELNLDVKFDDQQRAILMPMLSKLDEILKKPCLEPIMMTHGRVEDPIGPLRLAIATFVAQILSAQDSVLSEHIATLPLTTTLMEMFWTHPWNNFLHRQVTCAVYHLLNSKGSEAAARLVRYTRFVQETPKLFEDAAVKCGHRPYLAMIAKLWAQLQDEEDSSLKKEMQDLSVRHPDETVSWEKFCETALPEYESKRKTLLGGVPKPNRGVPVVQNTTAQYETDNGVDWDSEPIQQPLGMDDIFSPDSTGDGEGDEETSRKIFDLLCIKKSDGEDDDDLLNDLQDDGVGSADFGDFADFKNFNAFVEERANTDTDVEAGSQEPEIESSDVVEEEKSAPDNQGDSPSEAS